MVRGPGPQAESRIRQAMFKVIFQIFSAWDYSRLIFELLIELSFAYQFERAEWYVCSRVFKIKWNLRHSGRWASSNQ